MEADKALKIGDDFLKYLETGDKTLIERHSLIELKGAIRYLHKAHANKIWYKEIEKRINFLEDAEKDRRTNKWYHKPLWVALLTVVLTTVINQVIANKQRGDIIKVQLIPNIDKATEKVEMPELPITIVDKRTGNQLYIGKPIGHSTYYEFPIILNDGKGSYRIDKYDFFNKYAGKLVQIVKPIED